MKMQLVLLISLVVILASVEAEWTGKKCGVDNQKMYDRTLNADTCDDYCAILKIRGVWNGKCEINNGFGECNCIFVRA